MLIWGLLSVLLTLAVWAGAYRLLVRGPFDPFALLLYFFAFIFIGRGAVLALGLDTPSPDYLFGDEAEGLLVAVQLYAAAWLAIMTAAALLLRPLANVAAPAFPAPPPVPGFTASFAVTAGFTLFGCLVAGFMLLKYGDLAAVMRAIKTDKDLAGLYMFRQFASVGAFLSVAFLYSIECMTRSGEWRVTRTWRTVALLMIVLNLANIYVWGTREAVGAALVALVVGYALFVRRVSTLSVLTGIGGAVGALVGLRLLRDWLLSGRLYGAEQGNVFRTIALSMHQVRLDAFMLTVRDRGDLLEFRAGQDFVLGFLGAVPRKLWPGKPDVVVPGAWFRRVYEPDMINGWPFTVIGEWLVNFGLAGLFLGASATGIVFAALQKRYSGYLSNPFAFVAATVAVMIVFQNGITTQTPIRYILWIVPLFAVFFALRVEAGLRAGRAGA